MVASREREIKLSILAKCSSCLRWSDCSEIENELYGVVHNDKYGGSRYEGDIVMNRYVCASQDTRKTS